MDWTPRFTQLNDVLGDLVPHHEGNTEFVKAAGLNRHRLIIRGLHLTYGIVLLMKQERIIK